ncbi:MAG: CsgG/HfaB family protein [Candidatus Sericytochromatia bacterium]
MKYHLKFLVGLTLSLGFVNFNPINNNYILSQKSYAENKRLSIAIIDFDNNSGDKDWDYMQKGVPRILITNLAQNKGLKIVERAKLDKALKELNFSQTGLVSQETAKKLGKLIGADYALFGSITKFGTNRTTIVIDATIIDVQTGEVKYVESVRGTDENNIINLLDKLSVMIINDLVPSEEQQPIVKNEPKNNNNSNSNNFPTEDIVVTPKINMNDKLTFTAKTKDKERHIYISGSGGNFNKVSTIKGINSSPIWAPDGAKIAYVNNKFGVSIFDVKNNTTSKLSEKEVSDDSPKWNFDGKRIIFLTREDKNYAIYSADPVTHTTTALSPPKVDVKSFDVSKYNMIAYSAKVGKTWQIFLVDINGDKVQQLTTEGNNTSPNWSPDGTKIAFISDRDDYEKVYTMNSNSSNQRKLTYGENDEESPIWSPDGTKIAFMSIINKKGKVSVIDTNGTNQRVLTNDKGDYFDLKWLPNSRELGFTYDGNIYTVNVFEGVKSMLNLEVNDIEEPDWKK